MTISMKVSIIKITRYENYKKTNLDVYNTSVDEVMK